LQHKSLSPFLLTTNGNKLSVNELFFLSENLEAEERKLKIAVKRKQMILIHETYLHY